MTVLYLTNNPRLAGTARILTSWLTLGRAHAVDGCVVVRQTGELSAWLQSEGIPWTGSPMPWMDARRPLPALREAWRVSRWARRHGVSIVHCNEHDVYPFGVLVARLLRAPAICHVRFAVDRGFCTWAFGGWRRPAALLWTSRQQREDCAAAISGVVDDGRQHLIRLGPDPSRFSVSPTPRDEARRRFDIHDGEVVVGTATALRPIKRIHDFIELIAVLAGRDPRVVGLIAGGSVAGEEAYQAEVEQRIAASGLGRRLRWLGHLEPIEPFLRSLDVFVSTSEYETFGNSVAEAMACGLPVTAYTGGSVSEVIGEAGVVVGNRDLPALTAAVARLVGDETARRDGGHTAFDRVTREFNPAAAFDRLREVFDASLGRTG